MGDKIYYFAYGSNMDLDQMKKRCPRNYKLLGDAKLEEWDFFINSLGVASIALDQESKSKVYGLLYEISKNCLACLDMHEGHPNAYRRYEEIIEFKGEKLKAWVYIDQRTAEVGVPRPNYLERIIRATKEFNFPDEYIAHLKDFLPREKSKA